MPLLKFKSTVIVPKVCIIAAAVVNAANVLGLPDMLVTSGNDSTHKKGSKHYEDKALDFRTKHLKREQKHALATGVRARLGLDYDVILESEGKVNEHLHVEFDPR
jgi:hypothetical protein